MKFRCRVLSVTLSALLALSAVPIHVGAVVPALFAESALASFVTSSGFSWIFDGDQDANQVAGHLQALWTMYKEDAPDVGNLEYYGQFMGLSDVGKFILGQNVTVVFHGFVSWMQEHFDIVAGTNRNLIAARNAIKSVDGSIPYIKANSTYRNFDSSITPPASSLIVTSMQEFNFDFEDGSRLAFDVLGLSSGSSYSCRYTFPGAYTDMEVDSSYCQGIGLIKFTDSEGLYPMWSSFNGVNRARWYLSPRSLSFSDYVDDSTKGVSISAATAIDIPQADTDEVVVVGVGATGTAATTQEGLADYTLTQLGANALTAEATVAPAADYPLPEPPPSLGDYDLADLGAALTDVFPFCIPWDVVEIIQTLNATPQAPYFSVDLFEWLRDRRPDLPDTDFTLDLGQSQYAVIGTVSRWATTIGFCLALLVATKRLIWTTGG